MEREFVSYNEALALKELGFESPYPIGGYQGGKVFYYENGELYYDGQPMYSSNYHDGQILAPLYQQAFRWFREKYGYEVSIKKRKFEIQKLEIYGESDPDYYFTDFPFDSYEESELKCLRKLIEIVKRKNNLKL